MIESERKVCMKRFCLLGVLLFVAIVFMAVGPAHAGRVKIGVIDVQKIMQESKAAKDARGMFLMDVEAKRAVLKSRQDEVQKMEKELKEGESDTSSSAMKEKKDEIARAIKEIRRLGTSMEEELRKKDVELRRNHFEEIREIAKEFCKKKEYNIILEKTSIVFFDEEMDVTDEIIKMYDAKKK